jgi:4-hydroxy-tetrahydrodipicolinate synthase
VRLFRAAADGRMADAAEEQLRLIRLFQITSLPKARGLGPTAAALGAFKAALWLLGVIESRRTQHPLGQLDDADVDAVRRRLIDCGLVPTR